MDIVEISELVASAGIASGTRGGRISADRVRQKQIKYNIDGFTSRVRKRASSHDTWL